MRSCSGEALAMAPIDRGSQVQAPLGTGLARGFARSCASHGQLRAVEPHRHGLKAPWGYNFRRESRRRSPLEPRVVQVSDLRRELARLRASSPVGFRRHSRFLGRSRGCMALVPRSRHQTRGLQAPVGPSGPISPWARTRSSSLLALWGRGFRGGCPSGCASPRDEDKSLPHLGNRARIGARSCESCGRRSHSADLERRVLASQRDSGPTQRRVVSSRRRRLLGRVPRGSSGGSETPLGCLGLNRREVLVGLWWPMESTFQGKTRGVGGHSIAW